MKFLTLMFFISIVSTMPILAQQVEGKQGFVLDNIRSLIINVVNPAVQTQPLIEQNRLAKTRIIVVPGGPFPGPKAGISNGARVIIIPELFALDLLNLSEATIFASLTGQIHFPEWWANYNFWRSPTGRFADGDSFYDGNPPLRPLEFANMPKSEATKFRSKHEKTITGMFNAALIDVILHELGHHAVNNLYDPASDSPKVMKAAEMEADAWATHVFRNFAANNPQLGIIDSGNSLGRYTSISLILEMQKFSALTGVTGTRTHPVFHSRLSLPLLTSGCADLVQSNLMSSYCSIMVGRLKLLKIEKSDKKEYRVRASAGEAHAKFRLGMIELSIGNNSAACDAFLEVFDKTDRRIYVYMGWCFENSFFAEKFPRLDQRKVAARMYRVAAELGWKDAKVGLARVLGE